jgi:hypothetical protein
MEGTARSIGSVLRAEPERWIEGCRQARIMDIFRVGDLPAGNRSKGATVR